MAVCASVCVCMPASPDFAVSSYAQLTAETHPGLPTRKLRHSLWASSLGAVDSSQRAVPVQAASGQPIARWRRMQLTRPWIRGVSRPSRPPAEPCICPLWGRQATRDPCSRTWLSTMWCPTDLGPLTPRLQSILQVRLYSHISPCIASCAVQTCCWVCIKVFAGARHACARWPQGA